MKIDGRASTHTLFLHSDNIKNTGTSKENEVQNDISENRVVTIEISSSAQQISEDAARLERLNGIRRQLTEGTYNISGKDVANKILKVLKG